MLCAASVQRYGAVAMATIPAADSPARDLRRATGLRQLVLLAACLTIFWIVVFNPRALNDGDTYWHLGAGGWMLQHLRAPHGGPFSFTHARQPRAARGWLS